MNRETVKRIAAGLVLTTTFYGQTPLLAHEDLPGPPALRVKGFLKDVTLTAGFDNEPGTENWTLNVRFDHQGHGVRDLSAYGVGVKPPFCDEQFCGVGQGNWETKSASDYPVNHEGRPAHANANELRWNHVDCTTRNTVLVAAELIEKDVDEFGDGFVNALATGLPIVGNVIWYLIGLPRGNENYGKGMGQLPENGTVEVALVGGAHGAAKVIFEGSTAQTGAADCFGGEYDEYAALSADERLLQFDGLETALALAQNLQVETGNPGALTPQEVADHRRLGRELSLGAAQWLAGGEIQAAVGLEGAGEAIVVFEAAQLSALEGMDDVAMAGFRTAYSIAAHLLDEPLPGAPTYLDRQVALLPGFVAVAPEGYFEVGGTILGLHPGDTITLVTLEGQVAGMFTNFAPAAPERVALLADMDLGPVPAGQLLGMRRIDGGNVQGPDAGCPEPHLADLTYGGIFVDGVGPYLDPDPAGCGYGTLHITSLPVRGGGVVPGTTFESDGFVLEADFSGVEPGTYALNLRAEVETNAGDLIVLDAPLTAVVQRSFEAIFSDGLEEGFSRWSDVAP